MKKWFTLVFGISSSALLALVLMSAVHPAEDTPPAEKADSLAVKSAVYAFIDAIDKLDLDKLANSFAEDATAFYPFSFTPNMLNGRAEIREAQRKGFEWARAQLKKAGKSEPFSLNLNPGDMKIQMLDHQTALVSWHSHRATHAGRRSAFLRKVNGKWLIYHHHASNMQTETSR